MPTSAGPNISGEENLVFGFDLKDQINSFIGEPTTNLVSSNSTFIGDSGTQTTSQTTSWVFSGIGPERNGFAFYNNVTSPIPLKFPNEGSVITVGPDNQQVYAGNRRIYQYLTISPNTEYTVSHWVYRSGSVGESCAYFQYSDNFVTYIGGGYLPSYDDSTIEGVWSLYRATFTSLPTAQTVIIGPVISWQTPILFAMQRFQIERKSRQTPFTSSSRSNTQGLLDLTGNSSIDLSNVSFDSNAQMTFDGTNDGINLGTSNVYNQFSNEFTIEAWVRRSNLGTTWGNIIGDYYTNSVGNPLEWQIMISNSGQLFVYNVTNGYVISPISSGFGANTWINVVLSRVGTTLSLYANSNLISSVTNTTKFGSSTGNLRIGIDGNGISEPFTGDISSVKIYNRGLTSSEVLNNYNNTKRKYGI